MSASIDKYYIEALRKYYESSGDTKSKLVDFTSNTPSRFLNGGFCIEEGKQNFAIIDSFDATDPVVFTHKFLVEHDGWVRFIAGFVLDSQVLDYLHRFVTDVQFRSTPRGIATAKLVKVLAGYSKKGWDYNGFFYYMEAVAKVAFKEVLPYTQLYGTSMLRLQSMNDDVFLERGEIVPDPYKIEEHVERHGNIPFSAASESIAKNIHANTITEVSVHIQATYACLLKIGLIHHKKVDVTKKIEMFFDFLHNEIGVFMAVEAVLACLQFSGKGGSLIPIEAGARDVRKKLIASAWDVFLLRMPETLISSESNEHTSIYYVCTAEKALQEIGSMRVIRRVSSIPDGPGTLPISGGFREDVLGQKIGSELLRKFNDIYADKIATSFTKRDPKSPELISALVHELERQVSGFVKEF